MFAGCFLSRSRVRDVSEIQRLVRRAVRGWLLSSNLSVLKTRCWSSLRDKRSMLEVLNVCKQVLRRRWDEKYCISTSGGMSLSLERWQRSRVVPMSGKMRNESSRHGGSPEWIRDDDRRLECGACSASKMCRNVFFRARSFLFSSRWDSHYGYKGHSFWQRLISTAAC